MPTNTKPLILVDGSSYLYRAFHAMPSLTNSKKFPTGAVYGVVNMLKKLLNDYQPEQMAVIFDAKGKTFRDDLYPAYKATRKEMPSELVLQIEPLHQIVKALGLPLIMVEGVEADDVIGTLAHEATRQKRDTIISTGDKDLAQLVNEHVTLINTMTNTRMDPAGVTEKFGVPPHAIIDYLTLVGDTSDNVPGVPQVGPKTAVKWLLQYGSLDNIIKHAADVSGKVGESLRQTIPQLPLTKSLVTIKCDVPLSISLSDLTLTAKDNDALQALFKEMEFKNWLAELLAHDTSNKQENKFAHYETILTENDLVKWTKKLEAATLISFDTETTSLDSMQAQLVGVSFATEKGLAAYIPFGHDYENAPTQIPKQRVLSALKPILENPNIKKVGQHIKYDMEVLANADIHLKGIAYDTMLESYILDSASNNHDMDSLALKYLGWRTISFTDVAGKGAKQITFNQVTIDKASTYAAEDADVTLQLHHALWPSIEKEESLKAVFNDIEVPLISVLANMELTGVLIDPNKLIEQGKALQARLDEIEKEAYALAGAEFNINSPKQLQEILFDKLQLPVLQKTPTGQASTADPVLQELAHEFAMPKLIIEYRSLSKLISTYTSKLVTQINPNTGRIHTSYNQVGTSTGRLSSSDPNLQNIPIRSPEGRRIRQAFIAPKGYKLVSADYSQIELRLMAHISQDPNLLKAFANNQDIHKATAAEVWGVPLDQVTPEMRRNAKAINFGLLYGMSAFGLTRQIGVDRKSAQEYIDRYFARYPAVKAYMDDTRQFAKTHGYVETLCGRRLPVPEINSAQIMRQKAAERAAINAPLQGSAADIIKLAMIEIDKWITRDNIPAKMLMQVHDELVFEVREDVLDSTIEMIKHYMTHVLSLSVPILVAVGVGENWDIASDH